MRCKGPLGERAFLLRGRKHGKRGRGCRASEKHFNFLVAAYGLLFGGVSEGVVVLELLELWLVSVLDGVVLDGVVMLPLADPLMLPLAEPEVLEAPEDVVSLSEVLLRVASRLQPAKPRAKAARPVTRVSFN